jgi:hypothetical protein
MIWRAKKAEKISNVTTLLIIKNRTTTKKSLLGVREMDKIIRKSSAPNKVHKRIISLEKRKTDLSKPLHQLFGAKPLTDEKSAHFCSR